MNDNTIKSKLESAINALIEQDLYLLLNNIAERTIAQNLANHLVSKFDGYSVDCEYNGNIVDEEGHKRIYILRMEAERYGLPKASEADQSIIERLVYPDIIVHRRGKGHPTNILIIEIKKNVNDNGHDYDRLKLMTYTSSDWGNKLRYQLGAFIIFDVTSQPITYRCEWYKDGKQQPNRTD